MNDLPPGWTWSTLDDLGTWTGGGTPKKNVPTYWDGQIPWVSPKDMKRNRLVDTQDHITSKAVEESAAKPFPSDSIAFVVRSGILQHSLPVALVPFRATANQDLKVLTPSSEVNAEWLLYALLAAAPDIRERCQKHGTTVASIDFPRLKAYPLRLPPPASKPASSSLSDQRRRPSVGEASLHDAEQLLDRYEDSLLHAAFSGSTTRHTTPTWEDLTLGELCEKVGGTIQTGPFGSQLHKSDYRNSGRPVVMPKDVVSGRISASTIARVGPKDARRLARHAMKPGDIVQSRRGDLSKRAVVTAREEGWLCGTGCFLIRLGDEDLARFVAEHMAEPVTARALEQEALGVTLPNLNRRILKGLRIRLPPRADRADVLSAVASSRESVNQLRSQLRLPEAQARALQRSVLRSALSGTLLATEPVADRIA